MSTKKPAISRFSPPGRRRSDQRALARPAGSSGRGAVSRAAIGPRAAGVLDRRAHLSLAGRPRCGSPLGRSRRARTTGRSGHRRPGLRRHGRPSARRGRGHRRGGRLPARAQAARGRGDDGLARALGAGLRRRLACLLPPCGGAGEARRSARRADRPSCAESGPRRRRGLGGDRLLRSARRLGLEARRAACLRRCPGCLAWKRPPRCRASRRRASEALAHARGDGKGSPGTPLGLGPDRVRRPRAA